MGVTAQSSNQMDTHESSARSRVDALACYSRCEAVGRAIYMAGLMLVRISHQLAR